MAFVQLNGNGTLPLTQLNGNGTLPLTQLNGNEILPLMQLNDNGTLPLTQLNGNGTLPLTQLNDNGTLPPVQLNANNISFYINAEKVLEKLEILPYSEKIFEFCYEEQKYTEKLNRLCEIFIFNLGEFENFICD